MQVLRLFALMLIIDFVVSFIPLSPEVQMMRTQGQSLIPGIPTDPIHSALSKLIQYPPFLSLSSPVCSYASSITFER